MVSAPLVALEPVESSFTVMVTEAVAPEEVFAVMVVVPAFRPLIVAVVPGPSVTLATLMLNSDSALPSM